MCLYVSLAVDLLPEESAGDITINRARALNLRWPLVDLALSGISEKSRKSRKSKVPYVRLCTYLVYKLNEVQEMSLVILTCYVPVVTLSLSEAYLSRSATET